MKWFRFYSMAMRDAKVMRLTDGQFRFWVELLCMANESKPRGTLPPVADIALMLREKPAKVAAVVDQLIIACLIDRDESGRLSPHNWSAWQQKSDDVTTRTRRFRSKEKNVPEDDNGTFPERSGPVPGNGVEPEQSENRLFAGTRTPTDDEIRRVENRTGELFPDVDWGPLARAACRDYPPAWVAEAVQIGAEQGASSWGLIRSVLERFGRQKGSDSERRSARSSSRSKGKHDTTVEDQAAADAVFDDLPEL